MEVYLEKCEEKKLRHSDGISVYIPKTAFKTNTKINISSFITTVKTDHALSTIERSFRIKSTVSSRKLIRFSLHINQDMLGKDKLNNSVFFVEIRVGNLIKITSCNLLTKDNRGDTIHILDGSFKLPKDEEIYITLGSMTIKPSNKEAFHPVPHHLKIGDLGQYDDESCRRSNSNNCTNPKPQGIYPQCIPAGKASLYSAYQLVLPAQQRRWYMGTPLNHNPSPDEDGDFFPPCR